MSHVEFLKWPCRHVEFSGPDPLSMKTRTLQWSLRGWNSYALFIGGNYRVMEKSGNMKNWPKIMEFFGISHGILPILLLNCTKVCIFFATTKKLSIDVDCQHFPTFSAKRRKCKIVKKDVHGKLRNGNGQIFCQVCGNPQLGPAESSSVTSV